MSDAFRIRRCDTDDASALSLIAQATFLETFADFLPRQDILLHAHRTRSAEAYAAWLARPEARLWLAEIGPGHGPIGFAGLSKPDLPVATNADDIELKHIYVLSRFHPTGAGRALMQAALDEARAMGRARVLLGVNAQNARARRFYEKHGFAIAGTRSFQVGEHYYDDVVMAVTL